MLHDSYAHLGICHVLGDAQLSAPLLLGSIDLEFDFLLIWPEERELAESHVKGRAGERAIFMLDNDDINSTAEGSRVDGVPCCRDRVAEISNVLHDARSAHSARSATLPNVGLGGNLVESGRVRSSLARLWSGSGGRGRPNVGTWWERSGKPRVPRQKPAPRR